jgi:hypothetical protein
MRRVLFEESWSAVVGPAHTSARVLFRRNFFSPIQPVFGCWQRGPRAVLHPQWSPNGNANTPETAHPRGPRMQALEYDKKSVAYIF